MTFVPVTRREASNNPGGRRDGGVEPIMSNLLEPWRVTPPPARDFAPGDLARRLDRREAQRRRRAAGLFSLVVLTLVAGAGAGYLRADRANRAALDVLRDAHLAQLGAEVDS